MDLVEGQAPLSTVVDGPATDGPQPVRAASTSVTLLIDGSGTRGPAGPAGAPGLDAPIRPPDAREFTFTSAAESWVAEHEMGFTPAVMIYDPHGVQRSGVVVENNATRTVVEFLYPAAGRLTLS